MQNSHIGLFVAIDGPNGVGKSTLLASINERLSAHGLSVHVTKEVTSSLIGKFIRQHHKDYLGRTLALLVAADRQNHLENDILLGLKNHDVVLTDRYVASSLVFQRLDGVELAFLWKLNEDFLKPDLSIIVLASEQTILARMSTRTEFDRFEQSFNCADEIRLFKEAAEFMVKKTSEQSHTTTPR